MAGLKKAANMFTKKTTKNNILSLVSLHGPKKTRLAPIRVRPLIKSAIRTVLRAPFCLIKRGTHLNKTKCGIAEKAKNQALQAGLYWLDKIHKVEIIIIRSQICDKP